MYTNTNYSFILQEEQIKTASQLKTPFMVIRQSNRHEKARAITAEMKKYSPFIAQRRARANVRLQGVREKKKREAEEKDK